MSPSRRNCRMTVRGRRGPRREHLSHEPLPIESLPIIGPPEHRARAKFINGDHRRRQSLGQRMGEGCLPGAAIARDTDYYRGSRETSDRYENFVERGIPLPVAVVHHVSQCTRN